jgi:hypothetical protein
MPPCGAAAAAACCTCAACCSAARGTPHSALELRLGLHVLQLLLHLVDLLFSFFSSLGGAGSAAQTPAGNKTAIMNSAGEGPTAMVIGLPPIILPAQ